METILRLKPDHNKTVEDLMRMNAKLGGKNYLDLDSGDIVQLVEKKAKVIEPPEVVEVPKKKK